MIVAAVPLKRLAEAKSRLAPHLSHEQREELVVRLVTQTIEALRDSDAVERIVLVTAEEALGQHLGVQTVPDAGGLNPSLRGAASWAMREGARGLLIVPADLAFLRAEDISALVQSRPERGIAIAPTEDGGTGALLLSPPDVLPPAFGPDSFARHVRSARQAGLEVRENGRRGFSVDVDTLRDLDIAAL